MKKALPRTALVVASSLWWVALSCLIILTLLVVALRLSVDFVIGDPERIESILNSTDVGIITVGSSEVSWDTLVPTISVTDMRIDTADIEVKIAKLDLKPQIFPSIFNMRPIFDSSEISDARLDFFIRGDAKSDQVDLNPVLSVLLLFSSGGNFSITNSVLFFHDSNEGSLKVDVRFLDNFHNSDNWWIDASIGIGDFIPNLQFTMINSGSYPKTMSDLDFELYLRTTNLVIPEDFLLPNSSVNISADRMESWLRFGGQKFKQVHTNFSSLKYKNLPESGISGEVILWPVAGTEGLNTREWQGYIPSITHGDTVLLEDLFLSDGSTAGEDEQLYLQAGEVHVTKIIDVIRPYVEELSTFAIHGQLTDIEALIPFKDPTQLFARMYIKNGGVELHDSTNIKLGQINTPLYIDKGVISSKLDTPFSLHLANYYEEPWNFNQIDGEFTVNLSNPHVLDLSLQQGSITMGVLQAGVNFSLFAPLQDELKLDKNLIELGIKLQRSPMSYKDNFIPYELLKNQDLEEQSLRSILTGGYIQGEMNMVIGQSNDVKDYGLEITVADTSLNYLENRPSVKQFNGSLVLTKDKLSAKGDGMLLDTKVKMHSLDVDLITREMSLQLGTSTEVGSLLGLASIFLDDSQITMPEGLKVTNPINLEASVTATLDQSNPKRTTESIRYRVDMSMQDNTVYFSQLPEFPFTVHIGALALENGYLLQTRQLQASWYDESVEIDIKKTNILKGEDLVVTTETGLPASLLNVAAGAKKEFFSGDANTKTRVVFNPQSFLLRSISFESDITNLSFNLPGEWNKPIGFPLKMTASYQVNRDKSARVKFEIPAYIKGDVVLDDKATALQGWIGLAFASLQQPTIKSGLDIDARLTIFDIYKWRDWWPQLKPFNSDLSKALDEFRKESSKEDATSDLSLQPAIQAKALESDIESQLKAAPDEVFSIPPLLENIQFSIIAKIIDLDGTQLTNLNTQLYFSDEALVLKINSDQVEGFVTLPQQPDSVIKVVLNKILIPELKQTKESTPASSADQDIEKPVIAPQVETAKPDQPLADPLAKVDMTKVGKIDFIIHRLAYGENELGSWRWELRPGENMARLQNLIATYKDTTLRGEAGWIRRDDGTTFTVIDAAMEGKNIKELGGLVDASRGNIALYIEWPGSPAAFHLPATRGNMAINFVNGNIKTGTPALRFLNFIGLLNINTIGRRLRLDFSDQGSNFAFDRAFGDFSLHKNVVTNVTPFSFIGPAVSFTSQGKTELDTKQIDQTMVIRLSVGEALPLGALLFGSSPQTAVLLYFSNLMLGSPISALTSARYTVKGAIDDPEFKLEQLLGAGFPEVPKTKINDDASYR